MRVFISSETEVDKPLQAVMGHAKEIAGIEEKIEFSDNVSAIHDKATVLALGKYVRKGRERVIALPSAKALMSRADSISRIKTAFRLMVDPPQIEPMQWRLYDDWTHLAELVGVLDACVDREMVVDIETSSHADDDEFPAYEHIISMGFYGGTTALVVGENLLLYPEVRAAIYRFLERNKIIAHNGKFDLKSFPGCKAKLYADPMLMHYSLFPAGGEHGLKPLAEIYFGAEDWDEPAKKYTKAAVYKLDWYEPDGSWGRARKYPARSGYERIPRAMLYEYNAADVFWTWHLFQLFQQYLADDANATRVYEKRLLLSAMYMRMELKGWTADIPYLHELRGILQEERVRLWAEIQEMAGFAINPNSHTQVKKWFVDNDRELPKRKDSKKKMMPSSNEDAMNEVINKGKYNEASIAFAKKLLECRGNTKALGTYVEGTLEAAHGSTVHPTFNITGPLTGRLANHGAGAILTIPRDPKFRKMVIPSGPDRVLVKPDYGQLEMRLVAWFSKDPRFVAAFQPGMPDFFTGMMPEVYPDIDLGTLSKSEHKEKRNGIKPISHGANYGRMYMAIAKQLDRDPEEVKGIYERYMGDPTVGLIPWQNMIRELANNGKEIVTPFGFHYQAELTTDKNRNNVENSALAFLPQSTGNDICLEAALNIEPQLEQYDSWMVASIHDQLIVDSPIEHAKAVGEMMQYEMEEAARRLVGDELIFEAEPEYGWDWSHVMGPAEWDTWLLENGYV